MCLNDFYSVLFRTEVNDLLVVCEKGQEKAFNILQHSRPFIWKQMKEAVAKKAAVKGSSTFILISIFINENGLEKVADPEYAAIAVSNTENICVKANVSPSFDDDLGLHYSNVHVLLNR